MKLEIPMTISSCKSRQVCVMAREAKMYLSSEGPFPDHSGGERSEPHSLYTIYTIQFFKKSAEMCDYMHDHALSNIQL